MAFHVPRLLILTESWLAFTVATNDSLLFELIRHSLSSSLMFTIRFCGSDLLCRKLVSVLNCWMCPLTVKLWITPSLRSGGMSSHMMTTDVVLAIELMTSGGNGAAWQHKQNNMLLQWKLIYFLRSSSVISYSIALGTLSPSSLKATTVKL